MRKRVSKTEFKNLNDFLSKSNIKIVIISKNLQAEWLVSYPTKWLLNRRPLVRSDLFFQILPLIIANQSLRANFIPEIGNEKNGYFYQFDSSFAAWFWMIF